MSEPFHAGEVALQEQTGERDKAILNGRLIGDVVPAAAMAFVAQQTYCAVGWMDSSGTPWASLLEGPQGFARCAVDGSAVSIELHGGAQALPGGEPLSVQQQLGMLFIEFETRRRLRVNGVVSRFGPKGFSVSVNEAYPNCPKYIQKRSGLANYDSSASRTLVGDGSGVPQDLEAWLQKTDTMFVTSCHPERGVDCSHRGGTPGFMRLVSGEIHIPDYPGNSMFGTLGNINVNPAAGLCLLDFERSVQLHLSGQAALRFDPPLGIEETAGSGRWWTFRPQRWAITSLQASRRWTLVESSPYNPQP